MKTVLSTALQQQNKDISATFLNEWSEDQFKAMQRAIVRHFQDRDINTSHGNYKPGFRSFEALGEIMGFAYTSSSSYAGYWICNTDVKSGRYDGFHYVGFAITTDNKPYAILWDKYENEILQPL